MPEPFDRNLPQLFRGVDAIVEAADKILSDEESISKIEAYAHGKGNYTIPRTTTEPSRGKKCYREKLNGEICTNAAIKGQTFCLLHATDEELEALGKTRRGRMIIQPRIYTALEAVIEDQAERIAAVYTDAMQAQTPLGGPDHRVRLQAVEALLSRPYGLPSTRQEVTGPDNGAVQIAHLLAESPSTPTDTE